MRIGQNRFLGAIHMLLSDLAIRRAKPKEKAYTLNDGNGLSLLIEPNGSKGWRLRYRFAGKPKMLSLGVFLRCPFLMPGRQGMKPKGLSLVELIRVRSERPKSENRRTNAVTPLRRSPVSGMKNAWTDGHNHMPQR